MTALPAPSTQPAAQAPALFFLAPKEIKEHPDNPRQVVTADEELVDSVRAVGVLEPLVVAPPHSGIPARSMHGATWVLIAGHRRLAAAKAAGLDTVPAIARTDLTSRAAQVEAMLVENLHRADLTPVEEGDAYQLLLDLPGSTQASVARQVGQPVKRIRERIKLAKLSEQVRAKLQTHQVTIADALAIGEFDDDAKTQKDLLARVGDTNFDWAVSRARADRQLRADTATATEQLAAAGVKVLTKPPAGARKIADILPGYPYFGSKVLEAAKWEAKNHAACPGRTAWLETDTYSKEKSLTFGCSTPKVHKAVKPKKSAAVVKLEREQREAKHARAEVAATSQQLRAAHLAALYAGQGPDAETQVARLRGLVLGTDFLSGGYVDLRGGYVDPKERRKQLEPLFELLGLADAVADVTDLTSVAARELIEPALPVTVPQLVLVLDVASHLGAEDDLRGSDEGPVRSAHTIGWVQAHRDYGYEFTSHERDQFHGRFYDGATRHVVEFKLTATDAGGQQ